MAFCSPNATRQTLPCPALLCPALYCPALPCIAPITKRHPVNLIQASGQSIRSGLYLYAVAAFVTPRLIDQIPGHNGGVIPISAVIRKGNGQGWKLLQVARLNGELYHGHAPELAVGNSKWVKRPANSSTQCQVGKEKKRLCC